MPLLERRVTEGQGRTLVGLDELEAEARRDGGDDEDEFEHGERVADAAAWAATEGEVGVVGAIFLIRGFNHMPTPSRGHGTWRGTLTPTLSQRERVIGEPTLGEEAIGFAEPSANRGG